MPVASTPAGFESALSVADAVLYEGYLLYPYRRSSPKNRMRWQFGVLAPEAFVRGTPATENSGAADAWCQQTECLFEAPDETTLHVRVRFLQLQHRQAEHLDPDGTYRPVDALAGNLSFDEAVEQSHDFVAGVGELRANGVSVNVEAPAGTDTEALHDAAGVEIGRLVRRRGRVAARVRIDAEEAEAPFRLTKLRVRIENTADVAAPTRGEALPHSLLATHALLGLSEGHFHSLIDPPIWATPAAEGCVNLATYPVLAGEPGRRNVVLSAPIILYDHPRVAPESPGPLYDSGEIDEILSLRMRTLTEDEKREVRATDPRAAAILDRVDGMPNEILARLHGAVRSMRPARSRDIPWWEPGGDAGISPDTDSVLVAGARVGKGTRVRLHPRGNGTDAHDRFLEGRKARVEKVFLDVDGGRHVAVALEEGPERYHFFAPDELEPLP